jgi:esterase/lipase
MLSLGAVLQENHFNVYIFNFHGPRARRTFSDLGVGQADDLQAAIEMITKQTGINAHRVGLFGATTGGYAALVAAQRSDIVKALAVDSVYEKPIQLLDVQIAEVLGGPSPLVRFMAEKEFRLFNFRTKTPEVRANLSKLSNIPKMFISGRDSPLLASITEDLYNAAPDPKTLRVLEHSQTSQTGGAEKKEYENQILSFFLQNLPLRAD